MIASSIKPPLIHLMEDYLCMCIFVPPHQTELFKDWDWALLIRVLQHPVQCLVHSVSTQCVLLLCVMYRNKFLLNACSGNGRENK